MKSDQSKSASRPHLVWLCTEPLTALYAATWLETTRELRNLGWLVTLVAPGRPSRALIRGIKVDFVSRPEIYLIRQLVFHLRAMRFLYRQRRRIDIILFHEMSAPFMLPLRFFRHLARRSRPLIVMDTRSVHMEPRDNQTRKAQLRLIFSRLMHRAGNRWADGRTAITERMAQTLHIASQHLWGTWPSGVTLQQFAPAQAARRWPLPGETIDLVYIGSLNYERNVMALCHAVERVNAGSFSFSLSVYGHGTEYADLAQFAAHTKGRIRVLTPVPHHQVRDILAQYHVGTLPFPNELKFQVSSPIKLFEYMAAGLPIFATRIASHTDVIGRANCAFWVETATVDGFSAALTRLRHTGAALPQMGCEAARVAQSWSWRASATKLSAALEYGLERSLACGF